MSIDQHCFKFIVDNIGYGITVIDRDGRVLYWNRKMENITSRTAASVKGKLLADCLGSEEEDYFNEVLPFRRGLTDGQRDDDSLFAAIGSFISENVSSGLFRHGNMDGLTNNARGDDLKCLILSDPAKIELAELASFNDVDAEGQATGGLVQDEIYPRKFWEKRLREEFARCKRYHNSEMTLLKVMLDGFDAIQANYSRVAQHELIQKVSQIIVDLFRDIDIAGYYGGAEFACLFPNTDISGAMIAAERLRHKFQHTHLKVEEDFLSLTISIGIVSFANTMEDHKELVTQADAALHKAMAAGGDTIR